MISYRSSWNKPLRNWVCGFWPERRPQDTSLRKLFPALRDVRLERAEEVGHRRTQTSGRQYRSLQRVFGLGVVPVAHYRSIITLIVVQALGYWLAAAYTGQAPAG